MRFKNITSGPKGLRDAQGTLHMVEPGALSPELEPAPGEEDTGWFREADEEDEEAEAAIELSAEDLQALKADVQTRIEQIRNEADLQIAAANDRADAAENRAAELQGQVAELQAQIASFDRDGDGKTGGSEPAQLPSLSGKNKAELLEIAKAEDVEATEEMTNAAIVEAIEAKRAS